MFAHGFVRDAYLAGTFIALACGVIGWLVVLRGQVFAGDALSHVAFVGAIGAAVIGLDERVGLFALTLALAAAMAALGRRSQADDVVIGITFAWILGLGVSAAIAVAAMWGGLALSYAIPSLPPSTAIIGLAAAAYVTAGIGTRLTRAQ